MITNPVTRTAPGVDKLLNKSYEVVKAVYLMLPELTTLSKDERIQFLRNNWEKLETVLTLTETLKGVYEAREDMKTFLEERGRIMEAIANYNATVESAEETIRTIEATKVMLLNAVPRIESLRPYLPAMERLEPVKQYIQQLAPAVDNLASVAGALVPITSVHEHLDIIRRGVEAHEQLPSAVARLEAVLNQALETAANFDALKTLLAKYVEQASTSVQEAHREYEATKAIAENMPAILKEAKEYRDQSFNSYNLILRIQEELRGYKDELFAKQTELAELNRVATATAESAKTIVREFKADTDRVLKTATDAASTATAKAQEASTSASTASTKATLASTKADETSVNANLVRGYKDSVASDKNRVESLVIQVTSDKATVTSLKDTVQSLKEQVTTEASKATKSAEDARVYKEASEASKRAVESIRGQVDTQVATATQKAQEISNKLSEAKGYVDQALAAKDSVNQVKGEVDSKAREVKQDKDSLSNLLTQVTELKNQAEDAKVKAEAARDRSEDNASAVTAGQVNPDWEVTSPDDKAFIKNKPTLGSLAAKDSISWDEVQDKPPIRVENVNTVHVKGNIRTDGLSVATVGGGVYIDRSGIYFNPGMPASIFTGSAKDANTYVVRTTVSSMISNAISKAKVTWDSLENKPETFRPESHTHTISQITDLKKYGKEDKVAYTDITGAPTTIAWENVTGRPMEVLVTDNNFASKRRTLISPIVNNADDKSAGINFKHRDNAQNFEFGVNSTGSFFIWDETNSTDVMYIPPQSTSRNVFFKRSLDMGGNYIANLHDPDSNADAATKGYVDRVAEGKVDTSAFKKYGTVDTIEWADVTGSPSLSWDNVTGKPVEFTPAQHSISKLTDLKKYGKEDKVAWGDITGAKKYGTEDKINWSDIYNITGVENKFVIEDYNGAEFLSLEAKAGYARFTWSGFSGDSFADKTAFLCSTNKNNIQLYKILDAKTQNQDVLVIDEPKTDNSAVSKKYVDSQVATKLSSSDLKKYGTVAKVNWRDIENFTPVFSGDLRVENDKGDKYFGLVAYDAQGAFTWSGFSDNGGYVFSCVSASNNILFYRTLDAKTQNQDVLVVDTPKTDNSAVSKKYVDTQSNKRISSEGARGLIAGYEQSEVLSGTSNTITKTSKDTLVWNTSGACTLTFTPASTNECAVKVIYMKATAQTTLTMNGARWVGGEAPTWGAQGKRLTIAAHFINAEVNLVVVESEE